MVDLKINEKNPNSAQDEKNYLIKPKLHCFKCNELIELKELEDSTELLRILLNEMMTEMNKFLPDLNKINEKFTRFHKNKSPELNLCLRCLIKLLINLIKNN